MHDNHLKTGNHPPDAKPIVIIGSKVLQYPSVPKVVAMYLRESYRHIFATPEAMWNVECLRSARYLELYKLKTGEDYYPSTPQELWDMFERIAEYRDPWAAGVEDSGVEYSKKRTSAGYRVDRERALEYTKTKEPKQARVLAEILLDLTECGNLTVTNQEIIENMTRAIAQGRMKTKQDEVRIFGYYRPSLVKFGVITVR